MCLGPLSRVRPYLALCGLCVAWFACSALIILWTKALLSGNDVEGTYEQNHPLFPFPLLITWWNNVGCTAIGGLIIFSSWTRARCSRRERAHWAPTVRWPAGARWRRFLLPIGACTALEIGCANWSLQRLTVAFSTLLKCTAPIFVLFWSVFLGIEAFSWVTLGSLVLMCTGAGFMTAGNGLDFSFVGALVLLFGIALGGFRWALSQVILQYPNRSGGLEPPANDQGIELAWRLRPLEAVVLLAPVTALCLTPGVLLFELRATWRSLWSPARTTNEGMIIVGSLMGIATLVFALLWLEYAIVQMTSSLAISVVSIMKELLTILAGMIAFGDHVAALSLVGLLLSQVGFFVFLRHRKMVFEELPASGESVRCQPNTHSSSERAVLAGKADLSDDIEFNG
ncbi:hypothetical protein CCYA_CCYA01G0419 [Cyanidiococcus yangmingshanensis]|nr:hypothetical protein CCYA_CCYA01G0419 [Cyanidiococcus yangmingshanensis]